MDLLTLVLACSLHFDDELVTALARQVSHDNPLLVGDLVTLATHDHLTTVPEASSAVADILKRGGRPAVGLLGVPITWAARYGRPSEDLFDACTNIAIASAVLSEYASECTPSRRHRTMTRVSRHPLRGQALDRQRACILTKLGEELGASGYVAAVMAEIAAHRNRAPNPPVDQTAQSPIELAPDDRSTSGAAVLAKPPATAPTTSQRTSQPAPITAPLPTASSTPLRRP